jgi:hypothetical protein
MAIPVPTMPAKAAAAAPPPPPGKPLRRALMSVAPLVPKALSCARRAGLSQRRLDHRQRQRRDAHHGSRPANRRKHTFSGKHLNILRG